ncbi:MAG TPA: biotin synthase, partial [bacterium]|nr:biotin synthase [bacterium]
MDVMKKLEILSDSAKYDASCASSGSNRATPKGGIGNGKQCGICHSWADDGRCVSLFKVLF